MNQIPSESPVGLATNVSHKMGRCILRLQQYELLMKAVLASQELAGYAEEIETNAKARKENVANKTLGQLVGELTGYYLSIAEGDGDGPEREDELDTDPSRAHFRFQCSVYMDEAAYRKTKEGLALLVSLRNDLVHHFLDRFDLKSESGRHDAECYLDDAYATIDERFRELFGWAKSTDDARQKAAEFMKSTEFGDFFLYGVFPGQQVHWPSTTIVQQLLFAESECSENGWTNLARALAHIRPRWPDLGPARYGCRSWRQLIHESGLFETQKRPNPEGTGRCVWYRSRSDVINQR